MSMNVEQVQTHFRDQVSSYASLMTRLIPFYDAQRDVMLELFPRDRSAPLRVLDLGCGPGLMAERILKQFPDAQLTLFDLTAEMIASARLRLEDDHRVTFRVGDFRSEDFGSGYDVIVASLSLHHMELSERPPFANVLYRSLARGGQLTTSEVIIDESLDVRNRQYELWQQFMTSQGGDGHAWYQKHLAKDHPVELSSWLAILSRAGFKPVGCFWRYLNFAVVNASRAI